MSKPISAVVLSGGAAYGAYEVGVMKALFRGESPATGLVPLDASVFTGTSAGAYNAAAITMNSEAGLPAAVSNLEQIWIEQISTAMSRCGNGLMRLRGDPLYYFSQACLARAPGLSASEATTDAVRIAQGVLRTAAALAFSTAGMVQRVTGAFELSQFISSEPFERLIERTIDFEGIRNSSIKLKIATTNWETGLLDIFENRHMTAEFGKPMIRASAAIPGIFPPVSIDGKLYIDGGVVVNTPLNPAIEAGASELHVIYMDPDISNMPAAGLQSTIDVFGRVFNIALATKINEDIASAGWINDGLQALERIARGAVRESERTGQALVRFAGQMLKRAATDQPYQKLTIHRYHPRDDFGGVEGLINFDLGRIQSFIHRGYQDCVEHDCVRSDCLLPH